MKFKKGDIVYFKEGFIENYTLNDEINSNYQSYTHYRNQPYKIVVSVSIVEAIIQVLRVPTNI
jgi:hypothetical protein